MNRSRKTWLRSCSLRVPQEKAKASCSAYRMELFSEYFPFDEGRRNEGSLFHFLRERFHHERHHQNHTLRVPQEKAKASCSPIGISQKMRPRSIREQYVFPVLQARTTPPKNVRCPVSTVYMSWLLLSFLFCRFIYARSCSRERKGRTSRLGRLLN